jgi:light-regulated signal transduction histidine kinase (bacteriophytochrome)
VVKTVPIANFGFYVIYSRYQCTQTGEKTIKKQLQELEAQNAEMERFTYTVSHVSAQPLITIKGFAVFLLNDILERPL